MAMQMSYQFRWLEISDLRGADLFRLIEATRQEAKHSHYALEPKSESYVHA
jgi:hypothetical protein